MFAVLKTGGKQYKVAKDDVIHIERLPGEAGSQILFDQILLVGEGANANSNQRGDGSGLPTIRST